MSNKDRSRRQILHYVLSFCMSRIHDPAGASAEYPRTYGSLSGFVTCSSDSPVQIGDLVLLSSAPPSKWQLGWLVEISEERPGWTKYLIESIEDSSLCWWSNVGISFLQRRCIDASWRWTDRQWAFTSRWHRTFRDKDAYIMRSNQPVFGDGFAVTLSTRTTHGFDDIRTERAFADWRKVTKKALSSCYDEMLSEYEAESARRKQNAKSGEPA